MTTSLPFRGLALVLALLLPACTAYTYRGIRPTELPKLDGPAMGTVVNGPGAGQAIAVATRTVETEDGRLMEVRGEYDVRVVAVTGTYVFEFPVRAQLDESGKSLLIQSKNLAAMRLPLASIRKVEIRQPDKTANAVGGSLLALVLGVGLGLLVIAVVL